MWPLKTILYFALFWVACFMALVNPIWGVLNYLLAYQTHPVGTWWGIPLADLGMRFSFFAIVFTVAGLVTGRKHVPKLVSSVSLWEVGLALVVLLAAINLLTGYGYNKSSSYAFEKLWKMLVFVFILGRMATTRKNLWMVLWCLVIGSLYVGYDAYTADPSAYFQGRLELIGGSDFATTSGTGAHLAAMLPLIGVAFVIAKQWRWRLLAALSGAMSINAIVLCRTRSAFIGMFCGAVVALIAAPRPKRFRLRVLLVVGAVMAFGLTDNYFWARMNTLTNSDTLESDMATVNRKEIWGLSMQLVADHPLGVGPGNFPNVIGHYDPKYYGRSSHNTLIVCVSELGVHGGLVFLAMVMGSVGYLWRSYRLADRTHFPVETKLIAYGMLTSLVTYTIAGLGTERFYCESYWWTLVLPLCLYRTTVREVVFMCAEDDLELLNPENQLDDVPVTCGANASEPYDWQAQSAPFGYSG
jgi:hypothetical protein